MSSSKRKNYLRLLLDIAEKIEESLIRDITILHILEFGIIDKAFCGKVISINRNTTVYD